MVEISTAKKIRPTDCGLWDFTNVMVLDGETTFTLDDRKQSNPEPHIPTNKLVSIGWCMNDTPVEYYFVHHNKCPSNLDRAHLQAQLDRTTLLVGQNIKFDLKWLRECGFVYEGELWDTMLFEYVLARGQRGIELNLNAIAARYGLGRKLDQVAALWDEGWMTDDIDPAILQEYGVQDIELTRSIFRKQIVMEI